ncbi:MAG: hypothetical protein KDD69_19390 [Bdellovibrionales bacterium]|nr:hypothetical protein [Bdellovibrionales bacterium]
MGGSITAILSYWALCLGAALAALNGFHKLDPAEAGLPVFWEWYFRLGRDAICILFVVLPLFASAIAVTAKKLSVQREVDLVELLCATPRAWMRCACAAAHATFTLCVVMLPAIVTALLLPRQFAVGSGSAAFVSVGFVNAFFLFGVRRQIGGRLLYPLVVVLNERSYLAALALSIELFRRRAADLIAVVVLGGSGLLLLLLLVPLRFSELSMLVDGRLLESVFDYPWITVCSVMPYLCILAVTMFVLSLLVLRMIEERNRERFSWFLDYNVSPYFITKLARAGYFK